MSIGANNTPKKLIELIIKTMFRPNISALAILLNILKKRGCVALYAKCNDIS